MCDGTWRKVVVGAEWRGYWWCIGHCLLLCECADLWLKTDERERERERERQTDRQRHTHTETERDTDTDRQKKFALHAVDTGK